MTIPVYALATGAVILLSVGAMVGLFLAGTGPKLSEREKAAADASWGAEHAVMLNVAMAEGWALHLTNPAARQALLDFAKAMREGRLDKADFMRGMHE